MFEKSLYDLIRGMRNHKGNEREYIQDSIRECRKEIKGQDMDLKATALLKLTYLEMFGHDMSWASFNVLEVMSSQKFPQKKVGYLSAVQSFRSDTEVSMLAENLLKKDLTSTNVPIISLPLTAIPHVVNPSMANSLLSDLVPRLTHSSPNIRKKTIVTLYRLALVYPDTLRASWPKIKDRLADEDEDPSVTAAVANVVCELGWRRPQDFLPLAPRLFDLLVAGENNWMAIKIIKLFATLTPLEPRLVKKLLPPLTTLIKTTAAMSLLYECINGIITGGILEASSGSTEGDEIARLCVSRLRSMLVPDGDPNLKYVALLAYGKIIDSHPFLVSTHEDAILECIDDQDISIRFRALELVVGMVTPSNLVPIVERLLQQLRDSPLVSSADDPSNDRAIHDGVVPRADFGDEDVGASRSKQRDDELTALPDDYRADVVTKILDICARDTYSNLNDFEWYLDVLVALIQHVPVLPQADQAHPHDISVRIGGEIRNVAVRVKSSRSEAVASADTVISVENRDSVFGKASRRVDAVLEPCAFIVGEYASLLSDPDKTLTSLLHTESAHLPSNTLAAYIQASIKIFSGIITHNSQSWNDERKSATTLLIARIIHFLEALTNHSSLEIQELAVSYLELMRLATEAVNSQSTSGTSAEAPLLLIQAIPALFSGADLNPVAKEAQRKVPVPDDLDFETAINPNLESLLAVSGFDLTDEADDELDKYYYQRSRPKVIIESASKRLDAAYAASVEQTYSYQQGTTEPVDDETSARRRAQRRALQRDDPFYIPSGENSGTATPIHDILRASNGEELDVDSIPIMELDLSSANDHAGKNLSRPGSQLAKKKPSAPPARKKIEILADEGLDDPSAGSGAMAAPRAQSSAAARSLLQIDSSGLGALALDEGASRGRSRLDVERREAEDAEMARAMREIERLRLEMQRAKDRVEVDAVEEKVVSAGRKVRRTARVEGDEPDDKAVAKKKKKKKAKTADAVAEKTGADDVQPKKKKKKRQVMAFDNDDARES